MHGPQRIIVLTAAVLCWAGGAAASDALVHVTCAELSREQAAEVEARVRASLLMSELAAQQVRISCQPHQASVEVASSWGTLAREAPTSTARLQDDLVEAVDALLRELAERRAQAAHAPGPGLGLESPTAPPVSGPALPSLAADPSSGLPPPLPAALAPERVPVAAAAPSVRPAAHAGPELRAEATAETWPHALGLGGNVSFSQGVRRLRYGLLVGGATARGVNAAFAVTEWHAELELGWQPAWAAGFRGALGLGPSLLIVTPKSDTAPRAGTVSSAWFAELALGRPIWFGRWALAPSAQLRVFSAQRRVNVDANERFTLAGVAAALALGVIYAVN